MIYLFHLTEIAILAFFFTLIGTCVCATRTAAIAFAGTLGIHRWGMRTKRFGRAMFVFGVIAIALVLISGTVQLLTQTSVKEVLMR